MTNKKGLVAPKAPEVKKAPTVNKPPKKKAAAKPAVTKVKTAVDAIAAFVNSDFKKAAVIETDDACVAVKPAKQTQATKTISSSDVVPPSAFMFANPGAVAHKNIPVFKEKK